MSERKNLEERFLRHLTGSASESERQELERAALDDDELFDRLTAIESELVDAYVDGELDEATTRSLASLVDTSPRLQAKAETTMALERRHLAQAAEPTNATTPGRRKRRTALFAAAAVALAVVLWLLVQMAGLRASARVLAAENAELRARSAELEETVSKLEESNRALTRRLARLEAESDR